MVAFFFVATDTTEQGRREEKSGEEDEEEEESEEEQRGGGLQQIVCRMNSTTRLQGANNREELRNTHCRSDCHTLQIINCQGS